MSSKQDTSQNRDVGQRRVAVKRRQVEEGEEKEKRRQEEREQRQQQEQQQQEQRRGQRRGGTEDGGGSQGSRGKPTVKDLGRKARERFEKERRRRHEIVRIDTVPDKERLRSQSSPRERQRSRRKEKKNPFPAPRGNDGRRRQRKRPKRADDRQGGGDDGGGQIVDRWFPDTSHLTTDSADYSSAGVDHNDNIDGDDNQDDDSGGGDGEGGGKGESSWRREGGTKSSVVRLHGLPPGTTARQIRRFFSGLHPERIAVLLSCPDGKIIPRWDAATDPTGRTMCRDSDEYEYDDDDDAIVIPRRKRRGEGGNTVARQPPNFRVLLKFESSLAAELATKRTGEILWFGNGGNDDDVETATATKTPTGAAIAVTRLGRRHAKWCMDKLAIDAASTTFVLPPPRQQQQQQQQKKQERNPTWSSSSPAMLDVPLEDIEKAVRDRIDPSVAQILWAAVVRDLRLTCEYDDDDSSEEDEVVRRRRRRRDGGSRDPPLPGHIPDDVFRVAANGSAEVLRRWVDRLRDARGKLRNATPFPFADCYDPSLDRIDPSVRLANAAAGILSDDIERIDELLTQIRQRRLLFSDSTPPKKREENASATNTKRAIV